MTSKPSKPLSSLEEPVLGIIRKDPYLRPYQDIIQRRHQKALLKEAELTAASGGTLEDFASAYLCYGLHKTPIGWVIREWAPNAREIFLVGTFNGWKQSEEWKMRREKEDGNWSLRVPLDQIRHGDLYKFVIRWDGGDGERIPAWAFRVVQDPKTGIFSAQVWDPQKPYQPKVKDFRRQEAPLLIYECHVGMAQEKEEVGTFKEFQKNVLPRIKKAGYNAIQLMAIQEHPYYGSFGYHVSSLFAPSSRFGTPDDLKELIDTAHAMGLAVIMDLVHSHAVKNEVEGLGNFAGDISQFFLPEPRRQHPAWDSLCYDYGKKEVLRMLLSNTLYWMREFGFDGFRYDGVTSMLYLSHGLGQDFTSYADYFSSQQDEDAITFLMLSNKLVHEVSKQAVTIAEEVSGMPGMAAPLEEGGYGFDYRLAMNVPDYWIKTIKELSDEDWKPSSILYELTNRRQDERTISYVESHDQALVGDKTVIFRLIDADMYYHMSVSDKHMGVARGMALSKMIRLVTLATMGGGYLNFMGNEFGHPEWIDFPRPGNQWSHKYARRQWSLVDNPDLKYRFLALFDQRMLDLVRGRKNFAAAPVKEVWHNDQDQILAFLRDNLLFVFNFNPQLSFTGYGLLMPKGSYRVILDSDSRDMGGEGLNDDTISHLTGFDPLYKKESKEWLKLYLPARSALVLEQVD